MALATIREHKMRSFLTVLGVIIGTGTVIAVGSIITGLDRSITDIIRSFGPTTIIVFKFKIGFRNVTREEFMRKPLTLDNARAIMERCPSCQYVSPYLMADFHEIHHAKYKGNEMYNIDMGGTEEGYAGRRHGHEVRPIPQRHRQPPPPARMRDRRGRAEVVVSQSGPVGKVIEVDGHQLEVIGVMERPAANMPGQDDRRILLPYSR